MDIMTNNSIVDIHKRLKKIEEALLVLAGNTEDGQWQGVYAQIASMLQDEHKPVSPSPQSYDYIRQIT